MAKKDRKDAFKELSLLRVYLGKSILLRTMETSSSCQILEKLSTYFLEAESMSCKLDGFIYIWLSQSEKCKHDVKNVLDLC